MINNVVFGGLALFRFLIMEIGDFLMYFIFMNILFFWFKNEYYIKKKFLYEINTVIDRDIR